MTATTIDLRQGLDEIKLSDLYRAAQNINAPTETIGQAIHVFEPARQGNLRSTCHKHGYNPDLVHDLYAEAIHHNRKETTTTTK